MKVICLLSVFLCLMYSGLISVFFLQNSTITLQQHDFCIFPPELYRHPSTTSPTTINTSTLILKRHTTRYIFYLIPPTPSPGQQYPTLPVEMYQYCVLMASTAPHRTACILSREMR